GSACSSSASASRHPAAAAFDRPLGLPIRCSRSTRPSTRAKAHRAICARSFLRQTVLAVREQAPAAAVAEEAELVAREPPSEGVEASVSAVEPFYGNRLRQS